MARRVALYSAGGSDTVGWLIFDEPRWRPEYGCRCTFAAGGDEWSVELTMIPPYQQEMRDFFASLATDAAGWEGARTWASEDAEVELQVRNDGTQASVEVTMRWPPEWDPRQLGNVDIAPTDLVRFAADMTDFTAPRAGRRRSRRSV